MTTLDSTRPRDDVTTEARVTSVDQLASIRVGLRAEGRLAGLGAGRIHDLCLAVTEVLTNALVHGAEPIHLATSADRERILCRISDNGSAELDAKVGSEPPPISSIGGRGLWLVRQVVDSLDIDRADGRTVVTFSFAL